ncbi:helix-turn-helix domain-containing protein [Candidatus Binatus sp.]|uniref:TetR/AcrR family transcriptional regulator n=1 Tax=Candidatus Binatus sp. TaxID=2811406 RepID=UPI002F941FC6
MQRPVIRRVRERTQAGKRNSSGQPPPRESARASILSSAMRIIGKNGERAATFRAVATAAGVSHSLLQHHFGTKRGLVAAVEAMVAERFSAALTTTAADAQVASNQIAAGLSGLIAGDTHLRSYLRRALLEATPAGQALFARITGLVVRQLEQHGDPKTVPSGSRLAWLAAQLVAVNLAGVIFEPMLARTLGKKPFDPGVVAWRTEANRHFLVAALKEYVPANAGRPRPARPRRSSLARSRRRERP